MLILVGVLVALHSPFLLIARQIGTPALLLFSCMVVGFGLTYLSGLDLIFEERLFFGTVIGAMAVPLAGFVTASLLGFSVTSVWLGAAIALAVSAAGWFRGRRQVLPDLRSVTDRWARNPTAPGHPWPLLLVAVVAGTYVYKLFANAYRLLPDGLYAGTGGTWADWAAHLSYAGSFAYGANFPPQLPLDPGHHLPYPFMVDFLAASLVPLGASLPNSLVLSSALLAFAFAPVMYLAGVRLTGSRAVAALAPFIFTLSGGLSFTYFFGDLQAKGLSVLAHLPREYSALAADNYQWLTPLIASMLPQRSTLFGFAIVLIVLALLFTAVDRPGWQTLSEGGTSPLSTVLGKACARHTPPSSSPAWSPGCRPPSTSTATAPASRSPPSGARSTAAGSGSPSSCPRLHLGSRSCSGCFPRRARRSGSSSAGWR